MKKVTAMTTNLYLVCGQKTEIDIEAMFENGIYAKKRLKACVLKKINTINHFLSEY